LKKYNYSKQNKSSTLAQKHAKYAQKFIFETNFGIKVALKFYFGTSG